MPIKKCNEPECTKGAEGKTDKCVEHGGGKRCNEPECTKSAIGKTDKCDEHGGGKRCPNCIDWIDSPSGSSKYDADIVQLVSNVFFQMMSAVKLFMRIQKKLWLETLSIKTLKDSFMTSHYIQEIVIAHIGVELKILNLAKRD